MTGDTIAYDAERRSDEILSKPPRLIPVDETSIDAETMSVVNRVRDLHAISRDSPLPEIVRMMGSNGPFFRHFFRAAELFETQSTIPDRLRELLILRCAWLCGAPYAWTEHVRMGKLAGLTPHEVDRVTQGAAAPGWTDHEAALLRAAEELHAQAMITDATWEALAAFLDHEQLIEVPILVGHYHMSAFVQNALRLTPRSGRVGLMAR